MFRQACFLILLPFPVLASESLPARIDRLIDAGAKGQASSPVADDAEFLRRIWLDLAGTLPTSAEARAFLADRAPDKRARLVDRLLAAPTYARRMQEAFHLMLMERLGDQPGWEKYLHDAFAANRPWDRMAGDMLRGRPLDDAARGASFFLGKRLENYGQNPVDYPALARDVGRMFLGKDLRCAQCHDHLFVKEYKQADFQGLFAFVQNAYLSNPATGEVGEKPLGDKLTFVSVFVKKPHLIGPRLPGRPELAIPKLNKAEQFVEAPNRQKRTPGVLRFSPLAELAREVPASPDFSRNIVNRVWWLLLGRGLVHPLDLHHADNSPSHPELLDLLSRDFVAHGHDLRWLVRQIVLTRVYQRSSLLPARVDRADPARFLTGIEKRLSSDQLMWATLEATGMRQAVVAAPKGSAKQSPLETTRKRFARAFGGPVREPEETFEPSLEGALFLLNDSTLLHWLSPQPGNLIERLTRLPSDDVADELYLSVLTRFPTREERNEVRAHLNDRVGKARPHALIRLAWALLASTEFAVNH